MKPAALRGPRDTLALIEPHPEEAGLARGVAVLLSSWAQGNGLGDKGHGEGKLRVPREGLEGICPQTVCQPHYPLEALLIRLLHV